MKGKLYLIPCVISEDQLSSIGPAAITTIHRIKHYAVERARTARRFIKTTNPPYAIDELEIVEMEKNSGVFDLAILSGFIDEGHDVGLMSEAGCPGIADPGSEVVKYFQKKNVQVIPLVGPSSIFLALMASGMNGQEFHFHGYLPIKENELKGKIKNLEAQANKGVTQIFIETPYRNDRMFAALCKQLSPKLLLCIAKDVTGVDEYIKTKSIKDWRSNPVKIGKVPTVFLLGK